MGLGKKKPNRQFRSVEFKKPKPNGFNFKFLKECWSILKNDVFNFLQDFHSSGSFSKGANASFIALIARLISHKKGDYRPISLVGCMYKVVTKILAKRLQNFLHGVIDERQCTFLGKEFITLCFDS